MEGAYHQSAVSLVEYSAACASLTLFACTSAALGAGAGAGAAAGAPAASSSSPRWLALLLFFWPWSTLAEESARGLFFGGGLAPLLLRTRASTRRGVGCHWGLRQRRRAAVACVLSRSEWWRRSAPAGTATAAAAAGGYCVGALDAVALGEPLGSSRRVARAHAAPARASTGLAGAGAALAERVLRHVLNRLGLLLFRRGGVGRERVRGR